MRLKTIHKRPHSLRILAFSDCRVQDIGTIIQWVQRQDLFDLIVYAGDDISRFVPDSSTNYFEQLARISRYGLAAVIGNDDGPQVRKLIRGRKVFEIHSRPLVIGRFLFLGLEGAPLLPGGAIQGYTLSEQDITAHLERPAALLSRKITIVVSHAPPRGCLDEAMRLTKGQIGSTALRSFIKSNDSVILNICGHAHLCGGRDDRLGQASVLNVASHDNSGQPARLASIHITTRGELKHDWHQLKSNLPVSGICGIGPHYARQLASAGIATVDQLRSAQPQQVADAIHWNPSTARIFIARAQAHISGEPVVDKRPDIPRPPRIYLDIETDLRWTYCWLVGLIPDDDQTVKQFFAPHPSVERVMLEEMLAYLEAIQSTSMLHFSGSDFDRRILIQRLNAHEFRVPDIINNSLDCHPNLFYSIAIPGSTFGLKKLASEFGYKFRFPHLDGFQVAYDYQRAIESGTKVSDSSLTYNQDDVLALRFVIHSVTELVSKQQLPPTDSIKLKQHNRLRGV